MEEKHLPEPITNMEIIMEFRLLQLIKEQRKTNELLEKLLASKPKPRKKKGDEEQ